MKRRDVWSRWAEEITTGKEETPPVLEDPRDYNVPFCKEGRTPLITAIRAKHCSATRELLKRGANPDLHDLEGKTPLIHAVETKQLKIVRSLLEKGCDANKPDANGRTPLMYAAYQGEKQIFDVIAKVGGCVDAADVDGRTALDYARPDMKKAIKDVMEACPRSDAPKKTGNTLLYCVPEYINYAHAKELLSLASSAAARFIFSKFILRFLFIAAIIPLIIPFTALFTFFYVAWLIYYYELSSKYRRHNKDTVSALREHIPHDGDVEWYKQSRALSNALRYATRRVTFNQLRNKTASSKNTGRTYFGDDWETNLWLLLLGIILFGSLLFLFYYPTNQDFIFFLFLPLVFLSPFFAGFVFSLLLSLLPLESDNFLFALFLFAILTIIYTPFIFFILGCLLAIFITKRRCLKVQRRRNQAAIRFRDNAALQGTSGNIPDVLFALFLRSFQQDGRLFIAGIDFEAVLVYSIGQLCDVVALGNAEERLGAARLQVGNEEWQKRVVNLAHQAALIFMLPHNTPGVIWEIQYLLKAKLADKVVFIMPPSDFSKKSFLMHQEGQKDSIQDMWADLSENEALSGIEIPPYSPKGGIFTLHSNGAIRDWGALGMELWPWAIKELMQQQHPSHTSQHPSFPSLDSISVGLIIDGSIGPGGDGGGAGGGDNGGGWLGGDDGGTGSSTGSASGGYGDSGGSGGESSGGGSSGGGF
jgi:hypothetical protein